MMSKTTGWKKRRKDIYRKTIGGHDYDIMALTGCWILYCDMERVGFPGAWQRLRDAKFAAHNHAEDKQ